MITHGMIFVAVYLAVLLVFTNTKSWESLEFVCLIYPLIAYLFTLLAFWWK
jgi:hypothetical protein